MNVQNLNGIWDFAYSEEKIVNPVFDSFAAVPGCFDTARDKFGRRAFGYYRRKIKCSGKTMLTIMGAGLHYEIFIDGKSIGKSILAFSKEEFFFVGSGEHELLIEVDNKIYPDMGEPYKLYYDFYAYGGIYSDIYLTEYNDDDIKSIEVIPLDIEKGTVEITVESFVKNPEFLNISFDGRETIKRPFEAKFTTEVPDFKLWSPETPNLHTVTINNMSAEFGMRTLNWQGRELLLNGKALKLYGCNRHEAHPEFGYATPESLILNDLQLIKECGFNFLRGSHYPQKEVLLKLCDRMGILVWEEPLAWGNKKEALGDENFRKNQLIQCEKMVKKSINHPSVIIWGFLNEAHAEHPEGNEIVKMLYDKIRSLDKSRPISYASNRPHIDTSIQFVDIVSLNLYPGWYDFEEDFAVNGIHLISRYLKKWSDHFKDKPLLLSEIGAPGLFGDHSGYRWSEEYQADYFEEVLKYVSNDPRYTGVALWLFCDTKSYLETALTFGRPRGFNNKGIFNEYRLPKLAFPRIKKYMSEINNN